MHGTEKGPGAVIVQRDLYRYNRKRDAIGEGTYGQIYRGEHIHTKQCVAIKEFKTNDMQDGLCITAYREIGLLQELKEKSRHIIGLISVCFEPQDRTLAMIMECAQYDLGLFIKYHSLENISIPEDIVKLLMYQLLVGVGCLDDHSIVHRDLKPGNLLLFCNEEQSPTLKIADFGLAREYKQPLAALANNGIVVTLWYRAPELLLDSRHYTNAVDMWSVGCIFGELLTRTALFKGTPEKPTSSFQRQQMEAIIRKKGFPHPSKWPKIICLPLWPEISRLQKEEEDNLERMIQSRCSYRISREAFSLLQGLLEYDPERRLTPKAALQHPWFANMPNPQDKKRTFVDIGRHIKDPRHKGVIH